MNRVQEPFQGRVRSRKAVCNAGKRIDLPMPRYFKRPPAQRQAPFPAIPVKSRLPSAHATHCMALLNKLPNDQGMTNLHCRSDCGACCTAPSISSAIPGMPNGKPAGVRCVQLGDDQRCRIFGLPERPAVCASLQPQREMCGATRDDAMVYLMTLERLTAA